MAQRKAELLRLFRLLTTRKKKFLEKEQHDPYIGYLHQRQMQLMDSFDDFPSHLQRGYSLLSEAPPPASGS